PPEPASAPPAALPAPRPADAAAPRAVDVPAPGPADAAPRPEDVAGPRPGIGPVPRPGEAPDHRPADAPAAPAVDAPAPDGGRGLLPPSAEPLPDAPVPTVGPLPAHQLGDGLTPQDAAGRDVFVIDPVQPTRQETNPALDVAPVPDDKARLAPVPITP